MVGGDHEENKDCRVLWVHQVGMESQERLDLLDREGKKETGASQAREAYQDHQVVLESQYLPHKS